MFCCLQAAKSEEPKFKLVFKVNSTRLDCCVYVLSFVCHFQGHVPLLSRLVLSLQQVLSEVFVMQNLEVVVGQLALEQ